MRLRLLTGRSVELLRNLIIRIFELLKKVRANGQEVDASERFNFSNLREGICEYVINVESQKS